MSNELERQNPLSDAGGNRDAGVGQLFKEEALRGRIKGGMVMPDEPTFTQPKNGVQTDTGARLTFEDDVTKHRIKQGNDESVDAGYF